MGIIKKTLLRTAVLTAVGAVAYVSLDENTKELVRKNVQTALHTAQSLAEKLGSMVSDVAAEPLDPKDDVLNQWANLGL